MAPTRSRLLASVGALSIPAAFLGLVLLSPATRPSVQTPFVSGKESWPPITIPLSSGQGRIHRLLLYAPNPAALLDHPEVRLSFSVSEDKTVLPAWLRRPVLDRGTLRVVGTTCTYETPPGATLAEGQAVAFVRAGSCSSVDGSRGEVELALALRRPMRVAVQAYEPPSSGVTPAFLHAATGGEATTALPILKGVYVEYPSVPAYRRIDLLNYMWQIAAGPGWLWALLGGSAALALAGLLIFPLGPRPPESARRFLGAAALGASCLAGSLGIAHAVLNPPLFAPDEPYHLLGYSALIADPALEPEVREWMKVVHLQRIRFTRGRFLATEVGRPYVRVEDPFFTIPPVRGRSAVTAAVWSAARLFLVDCDAPATLLGLRLLNAALFALAVGGAAALATVLTTVAHPQLLTVPFLLVPALPYLATHVSEVAVLCAVYVVFSSSVVVLFLDGPRAHWAGLPLGLTFALALASSRQAWPLVALVSCLLATRVLLGTSGSERGARPAVIFWLGIALGGSLFQALAGDEFLAYFWPFIALLPRGTLLLDLVTRSALLVLLGVALLGALEVLLSGARRRAGRFLEIRAPWATGGVAFAMAAAVALSFVLSLVVRYPELPAVPVPNPHSAREYVGMVLAAGLTTFRLTPPDYLTWSSFWAAFGWLHFQAPRPLLSALLLLNGLCLIALVLRLARGGHGRRLLWLLAIALGAVASLALYALVLQRLPMNVNGRYLAGWHLVLAAVIWTAPALALRPRPAVLLALCGAGHASCLAFVLWRFF